VRVGRRAKQLPVRVVGEKVPLRSGQRPSGCAAAFSAGAGGQFQGQFLRRSFSKTLILSPQRLHFNDVESDAEPTGCCSTEPQDRLFMSPVIVGSINSRKRASMSAGDNVGALSTHQFKTSTNVDATC
jgi:hypothetical protein